MSLIAVPSQEMPANFSAIPIHHCAGLCSPPLTTHYTINEQGLQIDPKRSQRQPAKYPTDLDFADDIAKQFISTTTKCYLRSLAGGMITQVDDFKYLGPYIIY